MPDSFFASSKPRKRKRSSFGANSDTAEGFHKIARKGTLTREQSKKKYAPDSLKVKAQKSGEKRRAVDEELSDRTDEEDGGGIDDMDLRADSDADAAASAAEDNDETPAEKRLRLAKLYLESIKEGLADGEFDAAEIDKELISARLKQDVMEHSGKVHLFIADSFDFTHRPTTILRTRGHRFSVTSAVASETGEHLFTSGKEGSIIKWDLTSGKKLAKFHKVRPPKIEAKSKGKAAAVIDVKGHTDEVLSLALSGDGKYLASAGRDRQLIVWNAEKGELVRAFSGHLGHKDLISTLAFRKGTHQLYTGSYDRTIKLYDLSPSVMGYVETLFGHQDHVLALDALRGETCVSVGGRDKTARYWKIVEESQLVFRGGGRSRVREVLEGGLRSEDECGDVDRDGAMAVDRNDKRKGSGGEETKKYVEGSIECVSMIDETTFISGGDSGSICLWITQKKKPIFTQALSHGLNEVLSETEGRIQTPRWVTALASLRYSDLIASGSWEGDIRIWKLDSKLKSFSLIGSIPAPGVVNSLQLIWPPKGFLENAPWATPTPVTAVDHSVSPAPGTTNAPVKRITTSKGNNILLVAGMGLEHRLGRWMTVKEEGVVNGALVVALSPRTLA